MIDELIANIEAWIKLYKEWKNGKWMFFPPPPPFDEWLKSKKQK